MPALKAAHTTLLVTVIVALVAACGDKGDNGKAGATQVAAKVNKSEISIHQINGVLQRAGAIAPEQVKRASGDVLERLIDQELLVQQATEKKLDREAAVVQAVEAAKREIYARAYLEDVTALAARPDAAAIAAFYQENPALFAKRRIYNLQELSVQIGEEKIPALKQKIGDAKNFAEIVSWLQAEKIPFKASAGFKAAEQLPLELVPQFAATKDGQIVLTQTPGGVVLSYIVQSREQPMDEKTAAALIEQLITKRARDALVRAEIKRLRETSTVEYLGEFAKSAGATPATSTAPAAAAAAPASPGTIDQKALAKGAAGLK